MSSVLTKDVQRLQQDVQALEQKLAELEQTLQRNEEGIRTPDRESDEKGDLIRQLRADAATGKRKIAQLESQNAQLAEQSGALSTELAGKEGVIRELMERLDAQANAVSELRESIARKETLIAELHRKMDENEGKIAEIERHVFEIGTERDELASQEEQALARVDELEALLAHPVIRFVLKLTTRHRY